MSDTPLISVIIPLYNVEKYLEKSVCAIRNQTYQNLEIILVDDGSTDRSGQMCDEFAAADSRIKVIHKKNGGSSTARNAGLEIASGDYIAFSDSDDYAETFLYEKLLKVLAEHDDSPIAQMMATYYDINGTAVWGPYKDSKELNFISQEEMFRMLMMHVGDSSFCTKLIRADFMKKFRFPEGELNEDFKLLLQMLLEVKGIYSVEENGYNVILRSGSNTRNKFNPVFYDSMILNSDYAYKLMENYFPACRMEAERFTYVQRLDYLLHIPIPQMTKENQQYREIVKYLRKHRKEIKGNSELTKKQKVYLLLLEMSPVMVRKTHRIMMKCRKRITFS